MFSIFALNTSAANFVIGLLTPNETRRSSRYATKGSRVFMLIEYAQHFNKGQGIGFVIFGTTINRRVLLACKWNLSTSTKVALPCLQSERFA